MPFGLNYCCRRVVVFWSWLLLGIGLLGIGSSPLLAQEPVPPEVPAAKETPLREQTIYIPYSKLRSMFEKEGRGVFLAYEKFQELWNAAQAATRKLDEIKPPLGALITESESQATVQKDVVQVAAQIKIDILTEGWHEIPLRLTDAAIREAKVKDEAAKIIFVPEQGYKLLIEKKGKEPEQILLSLVYCKAFSKGAGTNSVQFDAPQAPVNRWQITISEPGIKVLVQPSLATNDSSAEIKNSDAVKDPAEMKDAPKETKVEAFVGAAPQVRIDWNPKAEGAAGQMALTTVQVRQEVVIEEGVMQTKAYLAFDISRADLQELTVEVPEGQNVVNVFDPNVQKWEKKVAGEVQTLTIKLFQPARGKQNVTIEMEKFGDDKEMAEDMGRKDFQAPDIKVLNVARQQGIVVARLASSLRGEVTTRNALLQIDAADLPAPLAGQDWPFAYRYAAHPYSLTISAEKVRPQIEVDELVEVYLEPQQTTFDLLAIYNIQKAGVFQLELQVPEAFEVRQVLGREVAGAAAVVVDSHHVDEVLLADGKKAKTKLVVNLARKALGRVALWVELQRRQEDANLQTPTGKKSVLDLTIPRVATAKLLRTTGRLMVYAPESLRINPTETKGLRAIAMSEAAQGIESTRGGRFAETRPFLAFAYTQEPAQLQVDAERRQPFITAEQLLFVQVESGVAKYEVTFNYNILYSGVKTLRMDVPAALYEQKELRLPPGAMKEKKLQPQPADVAQGDVALELSSDAEFLGPNVIKFVGERKLAEMQVGQSVGIELPVLRPRGIDRHTGKIAAAKGETIDLGVEGIPEGLRPIDPQRDLSVANLPAVPSRAFEFTDDWTLKIVASRYELEDVKRTSIDRAFVRMAVTRGDETTVQCLYRLRSAKQRVAIILPKVVGAGSAFDRQPLRVNNIPVPLEKDQNQFYIPLTGHTADEYVLVELRYTLPNYQSKLVLPEFPENPAVQQVFLAAFLPDERKLLGIRGTWSEEDDWRQSRSYGSAAGHSDDQLLAWVRSDVPNSQGLENFPTQGTRYLYSALRPGTGPAGVLTLIAVHKYVLWTAIVLLVAGVGLALTWRPMCNRMWWLGALVVGVVLSSLFFPTFAQAVLNDVLWWSLALVLLGWTLHFFAWALPMVANWMTARMARAAAVATAVAAAARASTAGTTSAAPLPAEIEFKDAQSGESHPPTTSSFTKGHTDEGKEGGIN